MNPTTIHDLPAAWRADPHANADGCARQLEEMLASMQVPAEIRTPDHPEANGRKPQFGEQEYVFGFIDEDGRPFSVRMGAEGWRNHSQHVLDMLTEAPSYNDCSLETRNALASQLAKVTAERDEALDQLTELQIQVKDIVRQPDFTNPELMVRALNDALAKLQPFSAPTE